jgi:hypothetical protein
MLKSDACISTLKRKTAKAKLGSALLNIFPSNASYSQAENVQDLLQLSPSRIDITSCADRTLPR